LPSGQVSPVDIDLLGGSLGWPALHASDGNQRRADPGLVHIVPSLINLVAFGLRASDLYRFGLARVCQGAGSPEVPSSRERPAWQQQGKTRGRRTTGHASFACISEVGYGMA